LPARVEREGGLELSHAPETKMAIAFSGDGPWKFRLLLISLGYITLCTELGVGVPGMGTAVVVGLVRHVNIAAHKDITQPRSKSTRTCPP
jgi:hypothetical protein